MQWPTIMTAMVTPFTEEDTIDEVASERLAGWLVRHGSDGLVVAGTTGESPTLSDSEREQLFWAVRRGAPGVPLWMGTGSNDTRTAIRHAREAERWGADGLLIVTPYYNKPPQEGLFRHYVAIASEVNLPIMIYNVPGRTGVSLAPETFGRIHQEAPQVMAIKEASGTLGAIERILTLCPDIKVYAGDDSLWYPAMALGATGVVSVAAHVIGPQMQQLLDRFRAHDVWGAARWHLRLLPIMQNLFSWPNPIPVKWVLTRLGLPVGPVRLPLVYPEDTRLLDQLLSQIQALYQEAPDTLAQ